MFFSRLDISSHAWSPCLSQYGTFALWLCFYLCQSLKSSSFQRSTTISTIPWYEHNMESDHPSNIAIGEYSIFQGDTSTLTSTGSTFNRSTCFDHVVDVWMSWSNFLVPVWWDVLRRRLLGLFRVRQWRWETDERGDNMKLECDSDGIWCDMIIHHLTWRSLGHLGLGAVERIHGAIGWVFVLQISCCCSKRFCDDMLRDAQGLL